MVAGAPVIETTLLLGTKVNMIVDAKTAQAIAENKIEKVAPGGWATFDDVSTVAVDMRQRAAITTQFKNAADGPRYVVELSSPAHFVVKPSLTNGRRRGDHGLSATG